MTTDITHEQTRHRFVVDGTGAELTYSLRGEGIVSADRTYVPDMLRGQGVAAKLVDALIETARERDWKIVPACSYVAAQFQRHPEWADLLVAP